MRLGRPRRCACCLTRCEFVRVLYQCNAFLPGRIGGIQILSYHLLNKLRQRGYDLLTVCARVGSELLGLQTFDGLDVVRLDFDDAIASRSAPALRRMTNELAALVQSFRPDIVHLNDIRPSSFFFHRGGGTGNLPRVLTFHSPIRPIGSDDLQLRLAADADRVVFVSGAQHEKAAATMPSLRSRMSLILNALPMPNLQPAELRFSRPSLLCISRLVSDKGIDLAIRAVAHLRHRGIASRLTIAGDGPEKASLVNLSETLGLGGDVEFVGSVMPDHVASLINRSTIVLMPSRWREAFGLVALQAAQMGRPTIAARIGGLPEVVVHGVTGLLVPPDDELALTSAIQTLLSDTALAKRLGENARRRASEEFDFDRFVDKYEMVYAEVRQATERRSKGCTFELPRENTLSMVALPSREQQPAVHNENPDKRDRLLDSAQHLPGDRDEQVHLLQQALAERDIRLSNLAQRLADREHQITALLSSRSWRSTGPLRMIRRWFDSLKSRLLAPLKLRMAAFVIARSDLFDKDWYRSKNPDVAAAAVDPVWHYILCGAREGRDPGPSFSTSGYLRCNPDVAAASLNPLYHFLRYGAKEGRGGRPLPDSIVRCMDGHITLDPSRETVLLISHEASRTGAPILAWNIATRLRQKYNVVALLLAGGELVDDFHDCCAAVIGPVGPARSQPFEASSIVRDVLGSYSICYAIANSAESRRFVPPLAKAGVPVVSLIHEFSSYTRPKAELHEALKLSTQIVFSTELTAGSAISEHSDLSDRAVHILPQGRCEVPRRANAQPGSSCQLRDAFRPKGYEDAIVVLGAGQVSIRKGVELFLSCAASLPPLDSKRRVRFIWIGEGYDPANDTSYSVYLMEQIARSGLQEQVSIISAVPDLAPAYAMADIFFLSSRLDAMPNVAIDAAFNGLPVVCFEKASGMASLLASQAPLRGCVLPYLDIQGAARVIAHLAQDDIAREHIGDTTRRFAEATFDMDSYVRRLDDIGREAIEIVRPRKHEH